MTLLTSITCLDELSRSNISITCLDELSRSNIDLFAALMSRMLMGYGRAWLLVQTSTDGYYALYSEGKDISLSSC